MTLSEGRVCAVDGQSRCLDHVEFDRFDAIILHYSLELANDPKVATRVLERIGESCAIKAVFLQDEYRRVDAAIDALCRVRADVLFTCVPQEDIRKVYPRDRLPALTAVNVLTGYVDDELTRIDPIPYEQRPIDIGYRARRLPYWLGELGQEKHRIGQRVRRDADRYGLVVDISHREEDRLYGDRWISFVRSCKAVLGAESGASVFDADGNLEERVSAYLMQNPRASFEEVQERFLAGRENLIRLNQISPRCFEAAALKTLMILYEGHYSGLLTPWRHYVPLRKDHANMDEVVDVLRDPVRALEITQRAYEEVACNPNNGYAAFSRRVQKVLDEVCRRRSGGPTKGYTPEAWQRLARPTLRDSWVRGKRALKPMAHGLLFGKILGFLEEDTRSGLSAGLKGIGRRLRRP